MATISTHALAPAIDRRILVVRGQRIILDEQLAVLYGVETRALVQAVKRNRDRFPLDFMFQLDEQEVDFLRSQTVISNTGRGGRRYKPYAFTEYGVAMLSSVLKSKKAILVNIEIMRAFGRLRAIIAGNRELAHKLAELEKKYDNQFKVVFQVINQLMSSPPQPGIKSDFIRVKGFGPER